MKTFTDPDTALVDLSPRPGSVVELRALPRPSRLEEDGRDSLERRTYQLRVLLVGWKHERGDDDFHLVIADSGRPDSTMIIEIPSQRCSNVCSSRLVGAMTAARESAVAHLGIPSESFRVLRPSPMVTVTGIAFFDFLHGQIGVAPNGIELHPVIGLQFLEQAATPHAR